MIFRLRELFLFSDPEAIASTGLVREAIASTTWLCNMTCRQPKNRLAYEMHVMLSATCCPPSALFCCVCPVVHVVGGSHGAVLRVERSFASRLRLSSASAAAGLARLGLLLWRSSGAPEHFTCAVSAVGAAFLRAFRASTFRTRQRSHGFAFFLTPRLRGGSTPGADLTSECLRLLQHDWCRERARSGQNVGMPGTGVPVALRGRFQATF